MESNVCEIHNSYYTLPDGCRFCPKKIPISEDEWI